MGYIGSSIKASWRASQLKAICESLVAGEDINGSLDSLFSATDNLRGAIHEFAGETDTKAIENALCGFLDGINLHMQRLAIAWVSIRPPLRTAVG